MGSAESSNNNQINSDASLSFGIRYIGEGRYIDAPIEEEANGVYTKMQPLAFEGAFEIPGTVLKRVGLLDNQGITFDGWYFVDTESVRHLTAIRRTGQNTAQYYRIGSWNLKPPFQEAPIFFQQGDDRRKKHKHKNRTRNHSG